MRKPAVNPTASGLSESHQSFSQVQRPARDSTFTSVALLLPSGLRRDLRLLYGALRALDDLVDEGREDADRRLSAVESWSRGEPANGHESSTFDDLASRRGLRPEPVADFCLAMRHDTVGAAVETEDDVDLYCRRVAGAVGVMVAQVAGARSDEAERRITALGIGVQRAHILRDIDLDRHEGRCYIAGETVSRFGSIAPGHRELLLKDQIARAEVWLDEGAPVRRLLPEGGRAAGACASLYREILRQIEREDYGRVEGCPVVPRWRRNAVIARAFLLNR